MNIFLISLGLIFSIQLNASDNLSGIDSQNLKTVLGRIDTLKQSAFIASTDSTRNDGSIRCFQTPGNDTYIGVEREYIIHAPYENVVSELDRFENYGQLFPEMKKVEVSEKNNDWVKVNFEQKAPLFFVPNTKYALKYQQITCGKDCKIYRFKLQNGNNLKFSDGFMMVTKKDDSSTTKITINTNFEHVSIGDFNEERTRLLSELLGVGKSGRPRLASTPAIDVTPSDKSEGDRTGEVQGGQVEMADALGSNRRRGGTT
jgi:hypothetical protein